MDEAAHKQDFKPIVIRDLFMGKNPRVGRWIPGFIYRSFFNVKVLAHDILEMFFLHNESYKHRNGHFVITFGKPIPFNPLTCDINN